MKDAMPAPGSMESLADKCGAKSSVPVPPSPNPLLIKPAPLPNPPPVNEVAFQPGGLRTPERGLHRRRSAGPPARAGAACESVLGAGSHIVERLSRGRDRGGAVTGGTVTCQEPPTIPAR